MNIDKTQNWVAWLWVSSNISAAHQHTLLWKKKQLELYAALYDASKTNSKVILSLSYRRSRLTAGSPQQTLQPRGITIYKEELWTDGQPPIPTLSQCPCLFPGGEMGRIRRWTACSVGTPLSPISYLVCWELIGISVVTLSTKQCFCWIQEEEWLDDTYSHNYCSPISLPIPKSCSLVPPTPFLTIPHLFFFLSSAFSFLFFFFCTSPCPAIYLKEVLMYLALIWDFQWRVDLCVIYFGETRSCF